MPENIKFKTADLPEGGATVSASPGKKFTRIHLDLADDGVTLAMVGAASAMAPDKRHSVTVQATGDGITLAMVGAASSGPV